MGWQAVVDSDGFRQFARHGPGRVVFSSPAYRWANLQRHRWIAHRADRADPERFAQVRAFCVVVGHTKSGASLLGGLLDAHPDVVMSDEHDALRYVEAGFTREQLWHALDRGARAEARRGRITARRLEPYDVALPGQSQGRSDAPRVVGDTTTGRTTRRLGADPLLFGRVRELVAPATVRVVHVVRNPFDPISVMVVRGRRTMRDAVDRYFADCTTLLALRSQLPPDVVHEVRHEDVVADPRASIGRCCDVLGVARDPEHLAAVEAKVGPRPSPRHTLVSWSPRWIREVERRIGEVDFLEGYTHGG